MSDKMLTTLYQHALVRAIDIHFARLMMDLAATDAIEIQLGAALLSRAVGQGNVCLDLNQLASTPLLPEADPLFSFRCPALSQWLTALKSSPVVGRPGEFCPMILDERGRLYLHRYWSYETALIQAIQKRCQNDFSRTDLDMQRLRKSVQGQFPDHDPNHIDWQMIATLTAVSKRFSVISGGPGTGKTYTVAKILAILAEQDPESELRAILAAPTGKAAARLSQTIRAVKVHLNCSAAVKDRIPEDATTIHRLLQYDPMRNDFYHHAGHRLSAETVIIDEASMVDLALMYRLIEALSDDARLVLVGDVDQLASVEAGSVLGDICDRGKRHPYSTKHRQWLSTMGSRLPTPALPEGQGLSGLNDALVRLQKNYRFGETSAIGRLSRAINRAAPDEVVAVLTDDTDSEVKWCRPGSAVELYRGLKGNLIRKYKDYIRIREPEAALAQLFRLQILSPLNQGPFGVQALNRFVEQSLRNANLIEPGVDGHFQWYAGRPVLVTANDYSQGLFNGDIGVTIEEGPPDKPTYDVVFGGPGGRRKQIPHFRLPQHETVYAMTVHKSQGSEFETVHLVLPDKDVPILTRELLYTAVTRAKKQVWIWGSESILTAAVARRIKRSSGLRDALWPR